MKIQSLIDYILINSGRGIVVPKGTYNTGALFLKNDVDLYLMNGTILLGSNDIIKKNNNIIIETV